MSQASHSFLTDPPFPEPMCKNHPERPATGIMAYRWCDECHENAKRNYAEQRPQFSIRAQDERAPDGRNICADHQGYYRRNDSERNDV